MPEQFSEDDHSQGDVTNRLIELPHPDDMPTEALSYRSDLSDQNAEDAIAELKADMYWYDITQGASDPRLQGLLARTDPRFKPETKISRSEKAAYLLSRLRLF